MYTEIQGPMGSVILRHRDKASIPPDPLNADYAEYLQWLGQGNQPVIIKQEWPSAVVTVEERVEATELMIDLLLENQGGA